MVNVQADLAISSATKKIAFMVTSLCDFAFVNIVCFDTRHFLPSAASAVCPGTCTYPGLTVPSYVISCKYGQISPANKTDRFNFNASKHILRYSPVLKAPVCRVHLAEVAQGP